MIKSKLMIYRLYLQCDMNAIDRMPCKHHFILTDFYLRKLQLITYTSYDRTAWYVHWSV